MEKKILPTPEMALRFATILFLETQGGDDVQRFTPFRVEDESEVWFVTGNGNNVRERSEAPFHDGFENESFYLHVTKADAEVKDIGIRASMKLSEEMKNEIRAIVGAQDNDRSAHSEDGPRDYLPDVFICEMLRGGIINSSKAAIQFGELVFENHFGLRAEQFSAIRAQNLKGIWHVSAQANGKNAELAFRRSNAQVVSLDLKPDR